MSLEAEMPGTKISRENLQIIYSRYNFVSQFVAGKQVLEVGCGPGVGLGYLAKKAPRVIGGDYSVDNLKLAHKHYQDRVELIQLDAHNLPFKDNCFDVVLTMATIIYLQLDQFFSECYRVLKKGGTLIFCTPNKDQPGFRRSPMSKNYFSIPELSQLLSQHFDAKFFGVLPIKGKTERASLNYRNTIIAGISKTLNRIPKGVELKDFINRSIFHNWTLPLPEEIEDGMVENIQPEPIRGDLPNFQYRVFYAIAFTRRI